MDGAFALIAAAVGALGAWLVSFRKLSGKVETSDAAEIWKEAAAIRADYVRRIAELNERVTALEARNDRLTEENDELGSISRTLRSHIEELEARVKRLTQENVFLQKANRELRRRVEGLEVEDDTS